MTRPLVRTLLLDGQYLLQTILSMSGKDADPRLDAVGTDGPVVFLEQAISL